MTSEQRYWWKIALELKLRKSSGDAFQDFVSTVMTLAHGTDFVRVRPYGSLGDKGCDGYVQSSGKVLACYGALNSDNSRVSYLIGKMGDDYNKAATALPSIMKEWHMVHNLVDGLPSEALLKLKELEDADKQRKFGFMGLEAIEQVVFSLRIDQIEDLLGMVATAEDGQNFQTRELRDLVSAIITATDATPIDVTQIKPVSPNKLSFNGLPGHWRSMIAGGWQNAHFVQEYLDRHHDTLAGEKLAQKFRVRYHYLKMQYLDPGTVMSSLYESITGIGAIAPAKQVAAQALLAHLFESCDIFENENA